MSRLLSLAAVAATLSIGGCAHQDAAEADRFAWIYQENEYEGAKLAYGAPNTDDVLLMMICEPGSGQVQLSAMSGAGGDAIVLSSRNDQDRFAGHAGPSVFGGAWLIEAEARTAATSLRGFARTGDLALMEGRRKINVAAEPGERAQVTRFFEACRV